MPESSFTIRLATSADVDALTELHCASFTPQDHVPVMLGDRYVRATYHWLVMSAISYVLVADDGGRIVGLIAVADRSFTGPMFKACMGEFVLSITRHPGLLLQGKLWRRLFRQTRCDVAGNTSRIIPGWLR